jgi:hypothetical protein
MIMNRNKITTLSLGIVFILLMMNTGCERSVDSLEEATYPANPDVFIDGFSGGLEYAVFTGTVPEAFQVDEDVTYDGSAASMRFDVPDAGDLRGAFAGGAFFVQGGRDLSGFNALTFYVRATQSVELGTLGFGVDLGANRYDASVTNVRVNTAWEKVIIPIPDPERLTQERGLFYYAFGPVAEDGSGYSVWIDEVKYENLGTIGQPRYSILNGENQTTNTFEGVQTGISGLGTVYNLPNGLDQVVNTSVAYFDFESSNEAAATVDQNGNVTVGPSGTAVITGSVGGVEASGSLTVVSQGPFQFAPEPTEDPADVISIFSDVYDNVPVDFYNGFYAPFQTTTSADFTVNGDNVLNYENFNFVGIEFNQNVPTIDASEMTELTMDIFIPDAFPPGSNLRIDLRDFGADGAFDGGDDSIISYTISTSLTSNPIMVQAQWLQVDFDITGLANRSNLGQIILAGDTPQRPNSFYVDNIYLRR